MKAVILLSLLFPVTWAAYKGGDCPVPCQCYEFSGIQSAYCNGTGINYVPRGIPNNTQLLDLSNNPIPFIKVGAIEQLPNLQYIVLNNNGYHEGSIEPGALDLPQLTNIDLDYNLFTSIPTSLPRKMTSLQMMSNPITLLKAHSFLGYPFLQVLVLSYTGLRKIEEGTFNILSDLRSVRMAFNNLTNDGIPSNLFSKNLNLTEIAMRFNQLERLLTNLPPSIQYLDYVGNNIKTIHSYAFNSTPNIRVLQFWEGQVTTIEDNAFYGLSNATILDFTQGHIATTITKDTFNGLTGLQTLYFDLNNISKIEDGAFRSFISLTSLWLAGNPFYCDCHLRWLREKVNNATYVFQDLHMMTCAGPNKVAGKAWDVLKPSDFVCP